MTYFTISSNIYREKIFKKSVKENKKCKKEKEKRRRKKKGAKSIERKVRD